MAHQQAGPVSLRMETLVHALRETVAGVVSPSEIAAAVAARLQPHLAFPDLLTEEQRQGDPTDYRQHILHTEPNGSFSVIALVWLPGQQTSIHDHVCWCVTGVYEGEERERRYRFDGFDEVGHDRLVATGEFVNSAGQVSGFAPPGDIHRVRNACGSRAISIHVYGADISRRGTSIRRVYKSTTELSGGDVPTVEARDHYALVCTQCGARNNDNGLNLSCPHCGDKSLLRTEYAKKSFTITPGDSGLFRYRSWLPVSREVAGSSRPAVYRSTGLGAELGLRDLWISFSGYWPERGCHMSSGSFKELEAYTVVGRTPRDAGVMVIASAGNTAAAFAAACRGQDFRCVLVVPERALPILELVGDVTNNVLVIALEAASYNDAIAYSRQIVATSDEFFAEGGVRNVGRRDGLAVVALAAYEQMGALPEFYFQAVGSGTGAIATYEASRRIADTGTDSQALPRMFLCQNSEFAPIHEAWQAERTVTGERGSARIEAGHVGPELSPHPEVHAAELVNARPPYAVNGGVRQVLTETSGDVLVADRAAAISAAAMFEHCEGVDIEPAAAVAVACLRAAVTAGEVPADARVLLNVTGGGRGGLRRPPAERGNTSEVWRMSRDYNPNLLAPKILGSLARTRVSAEPSAHPFDTLEHADHRSAGKNV